MKNDQRGRGYRSLFWPIVLISVGVIWLLGNAGIISGANIAVLFRLWPLILIVIGLDLLFGRSSPVIGALIGLGAVALLIILMLVGPSIGLAPDLDVQTAQFSEPLEDATAARVVLDLGIGEATVTALADSRDLFVADGTYVGEVEFETSGELDKTITLRQGEVSLGPDFFGINWFDLGGSDLHWDIGLSPDVPLELDIAVGIGTVNLDLSDLELTELRIDGGIGAVDLALPEPPDSYTVTIDGDIGSFTIDLPEGIAVRLEADSDIGDVSVPGRLERVSGGDDDNFLGEQGVWETDGFDRAERRITIAFDGNIGSLTVR